MSANNNGFLYQKFDGDFAREALDAKEVPQSIVCNLKHRIRPYQNESFKRFLIWQQRYAKNCAPHLLFNMATGSGKTMIMAGLMLALYEQGYRNFLFFVNNANIIQKTKDNFLAQTTTKYLFTKQISVNGREVFVKEVTNFADAQENCINIKFTTIQQLHTDLVNHKENGVTLEDLGAHKTILLADEAHHLNVETKRQQSLLDNWEKTVQNLSTANPKNLLLEFTATMDYSNAEIMQKYSDKIIYRYDLKQFRQDLYSKEINLFRSDCDEKERIIQALLLNVYRQELAAAHNINLKPIILFKARKTIAESQQNKENFHQLIDNFSASDVAQGRNSTAPVMECAFEFFARRKLSDALLAQRIRENFTRENCISANNDREKTENQIRLNTLEDSDNPLRAVFAVHKLNEGWDVLNLFDIVRLYETRDARSNKPGKTTLAEAQLIGRGARYFPFKVDDTQDEFIRKYDHDIGNDLKILEELYYHTRDQSQYISELKRALEASGIYEDDERSTEVQLSLKEDFKETNLYKQGMVFYNEKRYAEKGEINRNKNDGLRNLSLATKTYPYRLASGVGSVLSGLEVLESQDQTASKGSKVAPVKDIPLHVVEYALTTNPFYWFDNLHEWFDVESTEDFIRNEKYLGDLAIKFVGTERRLNSITHRDYIFALKAQLAAAEEEIKKTTDEFRVSEWTPEYVHDIFTDKQVRVKKEYAAGQPIVKNANWYAYNDNYGSPEEQGFVDMFAAYFKDMKKKYDEIYLVRNERQLKIYDEKGRRFEPDFLLFCNPKAAAGVTYQIFIEPKGIVYLAQDAWKETFLEDIAKQPKVLKIESGEYKILGLPFYNQDREKTKSRFENAFTDALGLESIKHGIPLHND